MKSTKAILAILISLLMVPPASAAALTPMNGGAAVCDTRLGAPSASAQTPVYPNNFSIVHEDNGIVWINVTPTLLGGASDICVVTVSYNGIRYGTAFGQGQAGAAGSSANPATGTCTAVGAGNTCASPASVRVDWSINFYDVNHVRLPDPTIYVWIDYTITVTSIVASTGLSSTASVPGTVWLWEPSVPRGTPLIGEPSP